ncbi:alpha-mannosidase 2C1-like [Mytilus trossulus]|uniref:alpha-mannosidase 2C1-like n=1 Tax=Mytilus trossulus TaxID=6551 RepID=UPI0030059257
METVVLKHKRTTLERAEKFISKDYFTDVNLAGRLYTKKAALKNLTHFEAPYRIRYNQAVKGKYNETTVGTSFGPTWSTHWFYLEIEVPLEWAGQEVHLLWNSGSEALVWQDGCPLQGLSVAFKRTSFPLNQAKVDGKNRYKLYVEMACNTLFGAGDGLINPPVPDKTFTLSQAEISVFHRDVFELILDIETLHDMAKHLPEESERGYIALYTVNDMINTIILDDKASYSRAHTMAEKFLHQGNGQGHHTIHAMGHAHIDSAWLWPYGETIRKCARSWSCTVQLMEKYPNFTFTCSQAQQYYWVKEHYPKLYQKIKQLVKSGQFIPVGGTWVEMDGNLPSGESFIRQFLYGQKFFKEEFDLQCKEFWLPDTFGYSAQLPQIMKTCGINRFLTQKLSWSLFNKFPHHTFMWEGIDGSRVLTHFPPGDSYEMKGQVEEVVRTIKNYKDKGRSSKSVFLFGYGDGGNGPSEEMLQRLKRLEDVNGLPRVEMSTPDKYFTSVEQEDISKLCRWRGELYLELHNGTYTTHAKLKRYNRKCEFMLHNLEYLAAISALTSKGYSYPRAELDLMWKQILLNQFHDVLPGSSIGEVFKDAVDLYKDVEKKYKKLLSEVPFTNEKKSDNSSIIIHNTLGWERKGVIALDNKGQSASKKRRVSSDSDLTQIDSFGQTLAFMEVGGYGYTVYKPIACQHHTHAFKKGQLHWLKNKVVSAAFDYEGRMTQLHLHGVERNAISKDYHGNQFVIFDDIPLFWDAWDVMDYHLETRKPINEKLQHVKILDEGPLRASLEFSLKISDKSYIKQVITLDAESPYFRFDTEVTWHENRKFLKVEFPTSIHSLQASYDIQYGHLQRTNHNNTSWDSAQFEVCGHKWADISEHGYGLALMNDCKYGYSCFDNVLRLSLLRSPKAPDETADMGVHQFTYAVMPHKESFQEAGVIQQAYDLNCPLFTTEVQGEVSSTSQSYFKVDNSQIILETVKMCEDQTKDKTLVLRLYESYGGKGKAVLSSSLPVKTAQRCNALEEIIEDTHKSVARIEGDIHLSFQPFEIITIMVEFSL